MPKRSSKKSPQDFNAIASEIFDAINSASTKKEKSTKKGETLKNPAAVALGRLGGLKGGKARAEKLSPKIRSAIARKAANTRWGEESRNGNK